MNTSVDQEAEIRARWPNSPGMRRPGPAAEAAAATDPRQARWPSSPGMLRDDRPELPSAAVLDRWPNSPGMYMPQIEAVDAWLKERGA